jgi:uncharacterized membrane protein
LPSSPHPRAAWRWQRAAVTLTAALVLLECLWEIVLAPARPGGFWLAAKALPLALLWPGLAGGNPKAGQLAALMLPLYFAEAIVRALTESGRHALVAAAVAALSVAAFAVLLAAFRARRRAGGT